MTDQEEFYERTGFHTFEQAKFFNQGFNQAVIHIRSELTRVSKPTGFFDAMLDTIQDAENDWFIGVVGG